jgi:hypothetical protein
MRRLLPRGARFRIAVIERIFLAAQIFHTHQGRQMLEALVDPRQVFLCPALVAPFSSTVVSNSVTLPCSRRPVFLDCCQ